MIKFYCPFVGYHYTQAFLSNNDLKSNKEIIDKRFRSLIINHNYVLIASYLIEHGTEAALLFIEWLGISLRSETTNKGNLKFGFWPKPKSPLKANTPETQKKLNQLLYGYDKFEQHIGYNFNDRSFLLQAMSHESFTTNDLTDSYERLEILGDRILNYMIARHLYEDSRQFTSLELWRISSFILSNRAFALIAIRNKFNFYARYLISNLNKSVAIFFEIARKNDFKPSKDVSEVQIFLKKKFLV